MLDTFSQSPIGAYCLINENPEAKKGVRLMPDSDSWTHFFSGFCVSPQSPKQAPFLEMERWR